MKKDSRIIEFDFIRGIACIMVILYHYTTRYTQAYGDKNYPFELSNGYMAVAIFFLLSGFLCMYNYNEKSEFKVFSFLKKKIFRLYPTFLICVVFTTLICLILLPERVVPLKDFILNLTMIPSAFKALSVDGVYWTLLSELVFYVFIGVILSLNLKNKLNLVALSWNVVLLITFLLNKNFDNFLISAINYAVIYKYGQHFIIGVMIYKIFYCSNKKDFVFPTINIILALVNNYFALSLKYTLFVAVVTLLMIFIVINKKYDFYNLNKSVIRVLTPLSFIAKISFPIYLVHQNFGYAIIELFKNNGVVTELVILIPFALSIVLGWLLNKFVEVPAYKFLSYKFIKNRS